MLRATVGFGTALGVLLDGIFVRTTVRRVTVEIPLGLRTCTEQREGDDGRTWLRALPGIVDTACRRWGISIEGEPTHGQVALVVPVRHPRGPAALKVSFPHPGNTGEAAALLAFAGRGAVKLLEADETGLVLVLEQAQQESLADQVARRSCPIEEAIEIVGDLAHQLAVVPLVEAPGTPLATALLSWVDELTEQIATHPASLPQWAFDQAQKTIQHLTSEAVPTMLHGDLHYGNVLRSHREPWLTIDPKGWCGTSAFDAFSVIAGGRDQLNLGDGLYAAIRRRVGRFARTARVDPDLALACCQARATYDYLYQLTAPRNPFDVEFLKTLALDGQSR